MAFAPLLLIAVLIGMWWMRRTSTLTRQCRWRPDLAHDAPQGAVHFRCVACGAETDCPRGKTPSDCLCLPA